MLCEVLRSEIYEENGGQTITNMNTQSQKKKILVKTNYQYLVRAKLYGVITLNCLEGMMNELDELIPVDMEKGERSDGW